MYPKIISLLLIIIATSRSCQNSKKVPLKVNEQNIMILDSAYLSTKSYAFEIVNEKIEGEGKKIFDQIFSESEFVVFGEVHNSKPTSELILGLINLMATNNFKVMALEVGPNTANILKRQMFPIDSTIHKLKKFNTKYLHEIVQREPIPYFYGVEDAKFLQKLAYNEIDIWGLDQEYFYSIFYFTDEIEGHLAAAGKNSIEILSLKGEVDSLVNSWMVERTESRKRGKSLNIFDKIQSDEIWIDYVNELRQINEPISLNIINDLLISWDIYLRWRSGSHQDRISYMRNNFLNEYEKNDPQKVFVKIGQVHASQILSNNAYDIGYLLDEMATAQGRICTNINTLVRYHMYSGKLEDNLKNQQNQLRREHDFLKLGHFEKYIIIDLREVRSDLQNGKIILPTDGDYHAIKRIVDGYDYQLILPLEEGITPNVNN